VATACDFCLGNGISADSMNSQAVATGGPEIWSPAYSAVKG